MNQGSGVFFWRKKDVWSSDINYRPMLKLKISCRRRKKSELVFAEIKEYEA